MNKNSQNDMKHFIKIQRLDNKQGLKSEDYISSSAVYMQLYIKVYSKNNKL